MKTVYIIDHPNSQTKIYGLTLLDRTVIAAAKLEPEQITIFTTRSLRRLQQATLPIQGKFPDIKLNFLKKNNIKTPSNTTFYANRIYRDKKPIFTYNSAKDISLARETLFQAQKVVRFPPSDFSQYFFSWAGKQLLPLAFFFNLSANQVTCLSILIAIIAAFFLLLGTHEFFLLGTFVTIFSKTLDYVDGRVARLRHSVSKFGIFFDTFADRVIWLFLILGSSVGVSRLSNSISTGLLYSAPYLILGINQLLTVFYKQRSSLISMHIGYIFSHTNLTIYLLFSAISGQYLFISLLLLPFAATRLILTISRH